MTTPPARDDSLLLHVARTVARHGLFKPGDRLVVALSGGADSTALLHLLTRLPGYNLSLVVAHLNHMLRGAASDADEEFCRQTARRYELPFECSRIDVGKTAQLQRMNLEDAGRTARYGFFNDIREKYGAVAVLLAHHADDQAETVLMRLLRGSGLTGLSGMSFRNEQGYLRPLLDVSRPDIERYLRSWNLDWREDASNADTRFLRNRIRHELLPLLETYNPEVRRTLGATARIARDDDDLLEAMAEQSFEQICRTAPGRVDCSAASLRELPLPLQRRLLRRAFKTLTGTRAGLGHQHVDALCQLGESGNPHARLKLSGGVTAFREYDLLALVHTPVQDPASPPCELTVTGPGRYPLPGGGTITISPSEGVDLTGGADTAVIPHERLPFPWLLRTFRPGDRMVPFGMTGRKKVKDIFIDRKVPLAQRAQIPLLLQGDALLWVAGVATSEVCRIGAGDSGVMRVVFERE